MGRQVTHGRSGSRRARAFPARLGVALGTLLVLGLFTASVASATYEQVDTFAGTPGLPKTPDAFAEEVQLGGVGGMAVNISGAGGVPPGTIYTTGYQSGPYIARFDADGEFRKAWGFNNNPPQPCGPEATPVPTVCPARGEGSNGNSSDVEVDQITGNIYVFDGSSGVPAGTNLIHVYSPDGSKLIAEFGEKATAGEATSASPEKIHGSGLTQSIAVDSAGNVYVMDLNTPNNFYHRLMVFRPQSPGDYEHYAYAGQSHDVWAGFANETQYPTAPVFDSAGDIYVAGESYIAKLDPTQPSAPALCEFKYPIGGINSMTIDPDSGEVFFFTTKDKKVHQLSACDEAGEFTETASFGLIPKRNYISAMAFNPDRSFEPSREAGVLYGGSPSGEGGKVEKIGPNESLRESSLGYVFSQARELLPSVESESVSRVTTGAAKLEAQINPKGSQTRYSFQYISDAAYQANEASERFAGAAEAPVGGAELGSGQAAISASAPVSGLLPDTTYHFRAIATSHCSSTDKEKACTGIGAEQLFHTFPLGVPGLPDERAYELVSPADKQGGEVFPADPRLDSCSVIECKPGTSSKRFPMQSTPDGDGLVYEGQPFSPSEGAVSENQYSARRTGAGWQSIDLSPALASKGSGQGYAAFDSDLSKGVLYQIAPSLTALAPSEFANLYAQPTASPADLSALLGQEPPNRFAGEVAGALKLSYAGASGDLSRIFFAANDALTAQSAFAPEALDGGANKNNLYEWSGGQLRLVNVMPGNAETVPGAAFAPNSASPVSSDGSKVFWSDEGGQVYVRENAEVTKAIPDPGKFLVASSTGSKVLLSDGCLYDLAEETCEDLSEGKGGFKGILGQSEDLAKVYFVDTAVLDETPNEHTEVAKAGQDNLYIREGGTARFIVTLAVKDNSPAEGKSDWSPLPSTRTAEASPDGRRVAFLSQAPLTGYDNTGPCETDHHGGFVTAPCAEAFLYDSATGKLVCASCNPSGARPLGATILRLIAGGAGGGDSLPQSHYLSNEGRLLFDSADSLTPADTNDGVEDVYEYEPEGVGNCGRPEGCISLVSSGHEPVDSNFLAMDEEGKNVFFTTRDRLTLKDKDELIDVYDARVGGGIPSETETSRGECQGEACQAQVSAPNDPTPASSSFEGAGNVDEKKPAKKHKRKHAKKHKAKKKSDHRRAAHNNRGGTK